LQSNSDKPTWLREFSEGTHKETYRVPIGLQFEGLRFEEVVPELAASLLVWWL
jgi:hypothetical protein